MSQNPLLPDEISAMWKYIEQEIYKHKGRKRRIYYLCASSVAAILLVAFFLFKGQFGKPVDPLAEIPGIEQVRKPAGSNPNIQLILDGGEEISLEAASADVKHEKNGHVSVNRKQLAQVNETADPKKIRYNQLIVPLGKRSTLLLPDGSKLWVNAASRVVYPADFRKDFREIYVEGEVFLDVTKDARRPFVVKTSKLDVTVLGTSFNVRTGEYGDSPEIVLVQGSVKVNTKENKSKMMRPNERLSYYGDRLMVHPVDVQQYISWKEGIFLFHSEPLGNILKRLSRYYGCQITCDPAVASLKCSGKLDLREQPEQVLATLTRTAPVHFDKEKQGYKIVKVPYKMSLPMDKN